MSAHVHNFDPDSGWCSGCTIRDDGRHAWQGSIVRPAHLPTTDESSDS